jgi:hypothetical protein
MHGNREKKTMREKIIGCMLALSLVACVPTQAPRSPDGAFTVHPGVVMKLHVSVQDEQVTSIIEVDNSDELTDMLLFNLTPVGRDGMMLTARSYLTKPIKYDLEMVGERGNTQYTSSCPVMPGASVFENWGHRIAALRVSNLRVIDLEDSAVCE